MKNFQTSYRNLNSVLVQYNPSYKEVENNIIKLTEMLSIYKLEDKIDIVLLPEMALTGYIFDSLEDIKPFLEEYNSGLTFNFCSTLAKRLNCYVFCGYPVKSYNQIKEKYEYYNSCMIVDREGNPLQSYKKHFLYEMDKTWCIEGEDFGYLEIETLTGHIVRIGIGICMDINPYEFTSPWEKMEMSTFCRKRNVDVILFLTNWIDNEPTKNTKKEILNMINYWAMRLEPFFQNPTDKPVYFLASDRCGKERTTTFIGCSCVLKIYKESCKLIMNLDKIKEAAFITCLELNDI